MKNICFNPFNFFDDFFREKRLAFRDKKGGRTTPYKEDALAEIAREKAEKPSEKKEDEKKKKEKKVGIEGKKERAKKKTAIDLVERKKKVQDNRLNLNIAREGLEVDPQMLDPTTEEGLKQVVEAFYSLQLAPTDVKWMEDQLKLAFDQKFTKGLSDRQKAFLQDPEGNIKEIGSFAPDFKMAYLYFLSVKHTLVEQTDRQLTGIEKRRDKDREPILSTVMDELGKAGGKLMTAVEERDWATIALYGAGAFALYKIWDKKIKPLTSGLAGDLLMYGTAAYAGLYIFKPELLKELRGKGTNIDIKGTAWENIANFFDTNPAAYEKGIEVGIMAAVSEERVKDIYGAMTPGNDEYDKRSAKFGMIQLSNLPIAFHAFDFDVIKQGPLYLDEKPESSLNAQERVYVTACRQLYKSCKNLRKMYQNNVYRKNQVSFEEQFLAKDAPDYTMEHLADFMTAYVPNYKKMFWDGDSYVAARKDLLPGADGDVSVFDSTDAAWIYQSSGTAMKAKVRGFPMIIKLDQKADGTKDYLFYLASKAGEGASPVATAKAGDAESGDAAREIIVEKIDEEIKGLIERVVVDGRKGLDAFDWNGKQWEAKMTVKGVSKFNVPPKQIDVYLDVFDNGTVVKCLSHDLKTVIVIDENAVYDYESGLLDDIMHQDDMAFNALNPFYEENLIKFVNIEEHYTDFWLIVEGMNIRCTFDGTNFSIADEGKDNERKLIQSPKFRKRYVEVFSKQEFGVFDDMKKYATRMPESYFLYFFEGMTDWVTGAKLDKWIDPSADCISGSIPDYFTFMLIESKKQSLEHQLSYAVKSATSFKDITNQVESINYTLNSVKAYANKLKNASPDKWRTSWGRNKFMSEIIEPLRRTGVKSNEYLYATKRFEVAIFSKLGTKGSDVSKNLHHISAKLFSVFSYYTAKHDKESLDKYGDPAEKANSNKYAQYFKYVEDQIIDHAQDYLDEGMAPENIPDAAAFKGIDEFGVWFSKTPITADLDYRNASDPISHDIPKTKNDDGGDIDDLTEKGRTPLEAELTKRYKRVVASIIERGHGSVQTKKLLAYLNTHLGYADFTAKNPKTLIAHAGRFVYQEATDINDASTKAGPQLDLLQRYEDIFYNNIVTKGQFFKGPIDKAVDWTVRTYRETVVL